MIIVVFNQSNLHIKVQIIIKILINDLKAWNKMFRKTLIIFYQLETNSKIISKAAQILMSF